MANRPEPALVLRGGDRDELERWVRASRVTASSAKRARIVLLAADGVANTRIAELVDATVTTVLLWRDRYQSTGLAGLADQPRSGRPRTLDHRGIVAETLKPPPKKLGMTHWSLRLLADRLKISNTSVALVWRACGITPWKAESFRSSTDAELVGRVTDICGLYLGVHEDVPESAIVVCVDEKSQIQALDRTVPIQPMQQGRIERRSHDYYRHGTSTLFAALDVATGQVTAAERPLPPFVWTAHQAARTAGWKARELTEAGLAAPRIPAPRAPSATPATSPDAEPHPNPEDPRRLAGKLPAEGELTRITERVSRAIFVSLVLLFTWSPVPGTLGDRKA